MNRKIQSGQGLVEYSLILVLIAVVVIVILSFTKVALTTSPKASVPALAYPYERVSIVGYPELMQVDGRSVLLFWAEENEGVFALYSTAWNARLQYDAEAGDCYVVGYDEENQILIFHLSPESC